LVPRTSGWALRRWTLAARLGSQTAVAAVQGIGLGLGSTVFRDAYGVIAMRARCSGRSRSRTVLTGLNVLRGTSTKTVFQRAMAPFHRPGSSRALRARPA